MLTTTEDSLDAMGGNCKAMLPSNLNTSGDQLISLREAICAANNTSTADTIILPPGTYELTRLGVEDANQTGDLDILPSGGDLTLQGSADPPTIIQGPGAVVGTDRVLQIDPECICDFGVTLRALTIQDGYGQDRGGGIYNCCANLDISDCTITGNQVSGADIALGGGIWTDGWPSTHIDNSSIQENRVTGAYADTDVYGGGVAGGGHIIITNSDVFQNQLSTGLAPDTQSRGGGIWVTDAELTIDSSHIQENKAREGGGIFLSDAVASVTDTVIYDNEATEYGAGIYSMHSEFEIQGSTISENEAMGGGGMGGAIYNQHILSLTNSTLSGNYAGQSGGGLYGFSGQTHLLNVTIAANTADDTGDGNGDGGGVYANAGSAVYLANSIIAANYDGSYQGHDLHPDCSGIFISQDYNLIGDSTGCTLTGANAHNLTDLSAKLKNLADNGGPTLTRALQLDSPALDRIPRNVNGCGNAPIDVDQRGMIRPQHSTCEMGAYEVSARLAIRKYVVPDTEIAYHGTVTCSLLLFNGGDWEATDALLTDELPAAVTFSDWVLRPGGAEVAGDVITWQGTLGVMGSVQVSFAAIHTGGLGDTITNTVQYSHASGSGSDTATFHVEPGHCVYLPLLLRE